VLFPVWTEWSEGLEGHLSVRELNEGWGAKWKRNVAGQKTEAAWRKKVVELVEKLVAKHLWDTALALRFLCDRYAPPKFATSHAFCDYLQKQGGAGLLTVLAESNSYT